MAFDFLNNPRTFIQEQTKRITILDTADSSDEAIFNRRFAFFVITPLTVTGFAAATTIDLLVNSKLVLVNDGTMQMIYPNRDFIWYITLLGGADSLSLELGDVAIADIVFQITGYEEATQ
jgi:hypothetical protein